MSDMSRIKRTPVPPQFFAIPRTIADKMLQSLWIHPQSLRHRLDRLALPRHQQALHLSGRSDPPLSLRPRTPTIGSRKQAQLGYRDRAGLACEPPGHSDAQVPDLGEGEILLASVPPEGATGELRALLPSPRLEARVGRPLLEEVAEGPLQVPEALLKGDGGNLVKPLALRLLLPASQRGARLSVG